MLYEAAVTTAFREASEGSWTARSSSRRSGRAPGPGSRLGGSSASPTRYQSGLSATSRCSTPSSSSSRPRSASPRLFATSPAVGSLYKAPGGRLAILAAGLAGPLFQARPVSKELQARSPLRAGMMLCPAREGGQGRAVDDPAVGGLEGGPVRDGPPQLAAVVRLNTTVTVRMNSVGTPFCSRGW